MKTKQVVTTSVGLVLAAILNLFAKDGLFPVEPPFRSEFYATQRDSALECGIDAGNQDAVLELDVMSLTADGAHFVATLDNAQPLDVVSRRGGSIWYLTLFRGKGALTKTQFGWPTAVKVILRDGTGVAPVVLNWRLYTAKNISDSSERERAHDTRRLWIEIASVGLLLCGVLGAFFLRDEMPRPVPYCPPELFDLVIALVRREMLGPLRTEFDGSEVAQVTLGTDVLREIILNSLTVKEALAGLSGEDRAIASLGYRRLRVKFVNQLERLLPVIVEYKKRLATASAALNVEQA